MFNIREQYIIAQALVIAIKELEQVPSPYTEISNIADMKHLLKTSFVKFSFLDAIYKEEKKRVNNL